MTDHPKAKEIWTYHERDGYDMHWSTFPPEDHEREDFPSFKDPVRYVRGDIADDLLEALEAVVAWQDADGDFNLHAIAAEKQVRAAIATAKGETND